ncbi:Dihydroxyacetone synthase [Steccherinum ochraceum]|uniref:Dihydroxyacetone synthase n=1 Tax=Steccherinum ochraceum TaxID=92696 RepID=A0A4R0R737_9APHY|nr:Dihydroxyacetone synthase [Steccherinum ochraceum]
MRVANFALLALSAISANARVLHSLLSRETSSVCASLANQPLAVHIVNGIPPVTIGIINVCLCTAGIADFMSSNIVAIAAVAVAGADATQAALTNLILSSASHRTCTYPDHSSGPVCSPNNVCGFTCGDGFVGTPQAFPTDCVCPAPNIVCNGKCISAAACPSSVAAAPVKRDLEYAKRNSVCKVGYTACGVFGKSQAWECVDTQSDLESCGGCTVPLTFGSSRDVDCTAIQGVSDVSCVAGRCAVGRCLAGYTRSYDNSYCIRNADLEAVIDASVLASVYGLEHHPLS